MNHKHFIILGWKSPTVLKISDQISNLHLDLTREDRESSYFGEYTTWTGGKDNLKMKLYENIDPVEPNEVIDFRYPDYIVLLDIVFTSKDKSIDINRVKSRLKVGMLDPEPILLAVNGNAIS